MRARKDPAYIAAQDTRRFWKYVDKNGPVPAARRELGPCWIWTGVLKPEGYGRFDTCLQGKMSYHLTHRWSYRALVGPIPEGLTLDHLCRERRCVRPEHLEPVTNRVNILRGESIHARRSRQTHCQHGHPFSADNTIVNNRGHRNCRACYLAKRKRPERSVVNV